MSYLEHQAVIDGSLLLDSWIRIDMLLKLSQTSVSLSLSLSTIVFISGNMNAPAKRME